MADFARKYPCGVMACGVLSLLLPQILFVHEPVLKTLLPAVFLLLAGCCFSLSDTVLKFALPGLIAGASLFFWQKHIENDPVKAFAGNRVQIGCIAVVKANDPSLFGDGKLLPDPKRFRTTFLMGAYSPLERMRKVGGNVLLRLPPGYKESISYGDILIVSGQLRKPEAKLFSASFDYASYLQRRNIHYILYADHVSVSSQEKSLTGTLLYFRRKFCHKVFSLLPEESRYFLAALLFGCAQGIKKETKKDLIQTGTIHILTVSGLHIGFFASIAALLCMVFPFQLRMFLIPLLTFFYAWMTGLNIPAVRALLMLSSYCFARGCFLNSSTSNSLFFAFVILMFFYPLQLLDAGLHYSFITTFALLLASEKFSVWEKIAHEKYFFLPPEGVLSSHRYFSRWKSHLCRIFAGCCAAWAASCSLTLFYQGIATIFSVLVNFLFVPLVWICFPVFFLGAFLAYLFPYAADWTAIFLEKLSSLILGIGSFAAEKSEYILPRPHWIFVAVFLLLFLFLLLEKKGKRMILAGLFLLLCLVLVFTGKIFRGEAEITVITGGGREKSCILVSIPEYEYAFLMDANDFTTVMETSAYLRGRGHKKVNTLVSGSVKSYDVKGLLYLFNTLKVDRLIMPESSRIAANAHLLRQKVEMENGENMSFQNENDPFVSFSFHKKELKKVRIESFDMGIDILFSGKEITLFRKKGNKETSFLARIPLYNTMERKVYTYTL